MKQKIKIIFMGTPEFAVPSLKTLIDNGYHVAAVVTALDKPVGRGQIVQTTPIKQFAQNHKLKVFTPEKILEIKKELKDIAPDLIVVCAYGKILPSWVLELPTRGALNIHPSLLPRFRGASPISSAILEGDTETGVTIIVMDEKMDEGDIIANSKFKIQNSKLTTGELTKVLADLSAKLLIEVLPKWVRGEIAPIPQNDEGATYTHTLKREDGRIIWTKSAEYIERQIRAFNPWPETFCYIQKGGNEGNRFMLKILDGSSRAENIEINAIGKVFKTADGQITVQTGSGLLILDKVQLEGRKPMTTQEFSNGHPEFIGTILQ